MTRTIKAQCGTELDAHAGEWVVDGRSYVESLDWLLGQAVEDRVVLTAHRVRQCVPADVDPAPYMDALWGHLGELIAEDERYAHDDGTAELVSWQDVPPWWRSGLTHSLRAAIAMAVDISQAAWQPTGETVTIHPDESVVLTREVER